MVGMNEGFAPLTDGEIGRVGVAPFEGEYVNGIVFGVTTVDVGV